MEESEKTKQDFNGGLYLNHIVSIHRKVTVKVNIRLEPSHMNVSHQCLKNRCSHCPVSEQQLHQASQSHWSHSPTHSSYSSQSHDTKPLDMTFPSHTHSSTAQKCPPQHDSPSLQCENPWSTALETEQYHYTNSTKSHYPPGKRVASDTSVKHQHHRTTS